MCFRPNRSLRPYSNHMLPNSFTFKFWIFHCYSHLQLPQLHCMNEEQWKLTQDITESRLASFTLVPLVPGFALGARLIPILPFILIARPADRESTNVARNERFTIHSLPNTITTNLAHLGTQCCHWFCLNNGNGIKKTSSGINQQPFHTQQHHKTLEEIKKSNRKLIYIYSPQLPLPTP